MDFRSLGQWNHWEWSKLQVCRVLPFIINIRVNCILLVYLKEGSWREPVAWLPHPNSVFSFCNPAVSFSLGNSPLLHLLCGWYYNFLNNKMPFPEAPVWRPLHPHQTHSHQKGTHGNCSQRHMLFRSQNLTNKSLAWDLVFWFPNLVWRD